MSGMQKKIIAVVAFICGLTIPQPILADPSKDDIEDFDELDLEELLDVVFTPAKHEQRITESPSAISVITREQIENTHCIDLICMLRMVPEVDIKRIAPGFSTVGARTLSDDYGNHALVLVDGREVNVELFGLPSWHGLPVHLEDIERIEIVRGPVSALYGANAMAMVISILTKEPKENGAEAFLGGGERYNTSLNLRVNQILGDWRLQLSGGMETSGRWRGFGALGREAGRVRLRVDRQWASSTSSLQVGLVAGDGDMYFGLAPGTAEALEGHLQLLHKTDNIKAQVSLSVFDGSFFMDLPLYFAGSKLGEMPDALPFFTANLDNEFQANFSLMEGNLWILGGNYRWLSVLSDANDPSEVNQHRVGFYIHFEQKLGEDLTFIAGIRFDYNNITPFAASPRLATVYRFAEDQFLRMSFGQAFRKPSFFYTSTHLTGVKPAPGFEAIGDLFRRGIGNENLDNEVLSTFEIGYVGHFLDKRLQLEGNIFFNLYRNIVNFQMDVVLDEFGMPDLQNSWLGWQNKGQEVDTLGATVSAAYRLRGALHLSGSYTFRYSWYIADPAVDAPSDVHKKGDRVPWEPAHLAKLSVLYLPEKGLRVGAAVYGQSSLKEDKPVGGGLFDETVAVSNPAHAFFSAFLAWRLSAGAGWVDLGVRIHNILNTPFRDLPAVARPDGSELGGHLIGRRVFVYFRGSI